MDAVYVGIDVAKAELVVAVRPSLEHWTVPNTEAGIGTLVERLRGARPVRIVLEATGGYETAVVAALALVQLPIVVANPRQGHDFAQATGQLAQTDRIDAAVLSLLAERVRPEPRPLADEATQLFDALVTRRRQLLEMRSAEKNRLALAKPPVRRGLKKHTAWLERELKTADTELREVVRESAAWRAKDDLLQSVTGVGRLSRKQIASLAGVAP